MSIFQAGMLPEEELKDGEGEVLKLEDFESLGCCIPGMAADLVTTNDEEGCREQCGRGSDSGYRVGKEGRISSPDEQTNGGLLPSSELKVVGEETTRYRTGGLNPGAPQVQAHGLSGNPNLIQYAINRYWGSMEHRPFVGWETLSGSANSTYGEYAAGNPHVRAQKKGVPSSCGCLCGGQLFAPDQHDWEEDYRRGMKKGVVEPKANSHHLEFTRELAQAMRTAMHLWFLLGRPQCADFDDLALVDNSDVV